MAAIGELVASVVHEMRNPLSSVKLNLQIIGRTLEQGSLLSEHYHIAIDQVSQLERMFTDLMNYSRPLDLRKSVVSLDRLVEESLMQLEPLTNGREISIEQNLPKTLPPVLADSDKMRQVLVNVIRNAVEATGRDGRVEITGGVEDSHGRVVVTLEVADNGSGISPQDLGRVFKPFFTTKQKGTGLGLPIVKKILEAHGYAISVSSEEAKGTVVHLQMQGAEE
jgi:two-component system sensor histidine kinase HydH